MQITAADIAKLIGGKVEGDPNVLIHQPAGLEDAQTGAISFLDSPKYEAAFYETAASVVIVSNDFQAKQTVKPTLIRVPQPRVAVQQLLQFVAQQQNLVPAEIHPTAIIDPSASIGEQVSIGAGSVIGAGAKIGANCKIGPQVFIDRFVEIGESVHISAGVKILHNCQIGDHCHIGHNTVVGSEGFGYLPDENGHYQKVPHTGSVILSNHVDLGASCTIDRGSLGDTIIGTGTKIDNLVQVAHNVHIGEHTVIAAQAGIAGSTHIGSHCQIGGQVGFAGHLKIADGTRIQAQSGIASHIKTPNQALFGSPAIGYKEYIRAYAVFKKLPELYKKMHQLEQRIQQSDSKPE